MPVLDTEIAAYDRARIDLEVNLKGKWVVFNGEARIGAFDSFDEAASEAVRRFGRGPYLIRQVGSAELVLPASLAYRFSSAP
jgi:hypothetical protein